MLLELSHTSASLSSYFYFIKSVLICCCTYYTMFLLWLPSRCIYNLLTDTLQGPGGVAKTFSSSHTWELFNLHFSTNCTSFNVWVRYFFAWNFKGTLWNSTQNILLIHCEKRYIYNDENLKVPKFTRSNSFLRPVPVNSNYIGKIYQYQPATKHSKMQTLCISLSIFSSVITQTLDQSYDLPISANEAILNNMVECKARCWVFLCLW